ncbi:hypothetical protein H6F76_26270 [Leptolyngbya sp. FACHB-321]|uniref:P-loop NTPase fold protein n=1 Tax=Leptolyngbya sp. FACHB-321 TaxID=2692807 RepID=UPI0016820238|nr:P-loop NTPase fold protein [Leptolyngbya sp. FACHB-321]MBD2038463.1 hypothetical protein [Leptolyngbya sp. FACHB-321]
MSTTNIFPSSIEVLHNTIASHNPFDRPLFVKQQDVWGKGFPDVPSLNAHASDMVFDAINKVRTGQRSSIGITIRAEKGLGKSHLISRIRHRLQFEGSALFVYMSEFSNLDRIKQEFLQNLAYSLKRTGSQSVMQWQELATALVSDAYKKEFQPKQLVDVAFPKKMAEMLAKGEKPVSLINQIVTRVLQTKPEIDNPYLIQAILWTLSKPHATFAINWLAGKGLSQLHAEEMGFPSSSSEEPEAESLDKVGEILNLIGEYKTLVVCFDELDSIGHNEQTLPKAMVVASLAKDVSNSLKSGVVLTAMYPETWRDQVKVMPQADAVIDRIGEKVIDLNYLSVSDVFALISEWLKDFYCSKDLIPPDPLYPFEESKLKEEFKQERPTFRKVLQWCANEFKVPSFAEKTLLKIPPKNPVESAYEKEFTDLEWALENYLEDKTTLVEALHLSFCSLIGQTVEEVQIKDIQEVEAKGNDRGYIDFRIVGKEKRKPVKIGVSIVQQSSGVGVSAALKRLIEYEKFDLTRGCLVRSKPISSSATRAQEYLRSLLLTHQGEWVLLAGEYIKPLLSILFVYNRMADYEVSENQIFEFLDQKRLVIDNPLIREILSKPSGRIPKNIPNEELPISIPTTASVSSLDDSLELVTTID